MDAKAYTDVHKRVAKRSQMYKDAVEMGVKPEEALSGTMETLKVLSAVFMSAVKAAMDQGYGVAEFNEHPEIVEHATLTAFFGAGGSDPEFQDLMAQIMAFHDLQERLEKKKE